MLGIMRHKTKAPSARDLSSTAAFLIVFPRRSGIIASRAASRQSSTTAPTTVRVDVGFRKDHFMCFFLSPTFCIFSRLGHGTSSLTEDAIRERSNPLSSVDPC